MMDYRNENLNKGEIEEQLNRRKNEAIGLLKDPKKPNKPWMKQ
jgi:hypothetical protein